MATAAPTFENREWTIGGVIERAFSTIRRNPTTTLGLVILVAGIPRILLLAFFGFASFGSGANAFGVGAITSGLIGLACGAIVQGGMIRATVADSRGQNAGFGECLSIGLLKALPLIGLMIISWIAIMFAMFLLVVPGVILMLMWSVAGPVLVEERAGIFHSLGRSRDLTRGSRWKVLGVLLVLLLIYFAFSFIMGFVGLSPFRAMLAGTPPTTAAVIGSVLLSIAFALLWNTTIPALYVELRRSKEGDHLEEVFA